MVLLADFITVLPDQRIEAWICSKKQPSFLRDITERSFARYVKQADISKLSSVDGLLTVQSARGFFLFSHQTGHHVFEMQSASLDALAFLMRKGFVAGPHECLK